MQRQTIERHHCWPCPSGWRTGRGRGRRTGSILKAAASQTRWLIYCIRRARPACLSGLKNLSYQTCTQRAKDSKAESLEAATYGKLGHISPERVVWKYSLCLLDISRQRQEHRWSHANVMSLSKSWSGDESLNLKRPGEHHMWSIRFAFEPFDMFQPPVNHRHTWKNRQINRKTGLLSFLTSQWRRNVWKMITKQVVMKCIFQICKSE